MPDSTPRRLSPTVLALLVLVVILAAVAVVRALTRDVVDVRVSPVTHENLVSQVPTNGKVEPIEIFQAHAPVAGVVEKVYVEVGQKVKAGELLLQMDDSEARYRLAAAGSSMRSAENAQSDMSRGGTQEERIANEGELTRAQQQQQQAATALASLKQLQGKGAASEAEVAAAQDRLTTAESALRTAEQRSSSRYSQGDLARSAAVVNEARASLNAAKQAYDHVNIRAPFAGTVYSIPVSDFDFVPGGEDLIDVADLTRIHIRAYFDEPDIGKLAAGQAVRIVWDAKPNRSWHGHVAVPPTTVISYGTRNVGECLITVDDADGELLPNTNVTVTVTYSQRFNVLSVPREALHTEGATSFVYRVVNHRLQRTVVQVGALNLTRVEITGGLTEKDIVALTATSSRDLVNGLEVRAVE